MIQLAPKIYWTRLIFELDKSHADYKDYSGGKGYAIVKANDASEALEKIKEELTSYNLRSVAFEFVKEYGIEIWEKTESLEYMNSLADKASKNGKVVLSEIFGVKRQKEEAR